jgi:hypothetical protein
MSPAINVRAPLANLRVTCPPKHAFASVHFNGDISPDIRDHLSGVNGKAAAKFVSFPDGAEPGQFFISGRTQGAWNCVLPDHFIQSLTRLQREVPNFDALITGVLFGKGKTNIVLFSTGFLTDFDDEISSTEHPLYKVRAALGTAVESMSPGATNWD